jgi:tRNA(fMet)-specific endonuclease VapC
MWLGGDDETERAARQAHVQQAEADFEPLPFDAAAAQAFGQVASDLRTAGRTTKARAYDALIAAIAVAHQLPIYTVNPQDFEHISDLEIVPIPHPDTTSESKPSE